MYTVSIDSNNSNICRMTFENNPCYVVLFDRQDRQRVVADKTWRIDKNCANSLMVRSVKTGEYLHRFIAGIPKGQRIRISNKHNGIQKANYLDCRREVLTKWVQQSSIASTVMMFKTFQAYDYHILDCAHEMKIRNLLDAKSRQVLGRVGTMLRHDISPSSEDVIEAKKAFKAAMQLGYDPTTAQRYKKYPPSKQFIVI